ncbi:DUF1559 family PulG-like putative transporter [Schlesneria paludicola]|uniref:DUF1559 family PulG-like putative transporter n=1 Tax=Schlesneria paludicola TaxID=360056 RepID=UPI00029B55DE|nr:DUF1559 domain-containing protein [Schlesneria paludicola]
MKQYLTPGTPKPHAATTSHRTAFSRMDLVGVLLVTFILLAMIPAWILSARSSASKLKCLCHIRQLGISVMNVSSNLGGGLPPLVDAVEITNQQGQTGTLNRTLMMSLLPALDHSSLRRNIEQNAVLAPSPDNPTSMTMSEADKISLDVFTCPVDLDAANTPGRLSYVANIGFISRDLFEGDPKGFHQLGSLNWHGTDAPDTSSDLQISGATGVFWRRHPDFAQTLDEISTNDGQSATLMLTENRQAGTWYDTDTARIGFGLPIAVNQQQVLFGAGTSLESSRRPLNTEFVGSTLGTQSSPEWRMNRGVTSRSEAAKARPSSLHAGGVFVMFCDASGKFLSGSIDAHVYVKLLTTNGISFGEQPFDPNAY